MKIIKFILSVIFFALGILVLLFVIRNRKELATISGTEILTNIFKYPKLFIGYLLTLVCFFISLKNSYKSTKSTSLIIRIIAVIILLLSIAGLVIEFIVIKKGGIDGIF